MYNPFKKENEGRPVRGRPPKPPMVKAPVQEEEEEDLPLDDEQPEEDEQQEDDEQVIERSIPTKKATAPQASIKKEVIDDGTYEIRQVAIQTAPIAYNVKTGEQKELFDLVVEISNRLARLEKDIRG